MSEGMPEILGAETTAPPEFGPRIRGIHTTKGAEGLCRKCGKICPTGPDLCIGYIEGVTAACCGHDVVEPWVVFQGGIEYRGAPAEQIFAKHLRGETVP